MRTKTLNTYYFRKLRREAKQYWRVIIYTNGAALQYYNSITAEWTTRDAYRLESIQKAKDDCDRARREWILGKVKQLRAEKELGNY